MATASPQAMGLSAARLEGTGPVVEVLHEEVLLADVPDHCLECVTTSRVVVRVEGEVVWTRDVPGWPTSLDEGTWLQEPVSGHLLGVFVGQGEAQSGAIVVDVDPAGRTARTTEVFLTGSGC